MPYVVVTCCTIRKRINPSKCLQARSLRSGVLTEVASDWIRRVEIVPPVAKAKELYCGRAFSEATLAADELASDLWIVSAGLGLIQGTAPVPAYSLTTTPRADDSIVTKIESQGWAPSRWWEQLIHRRQGSSSIRKLLSTYPNETILAALPESYAALVAGELNDLDREDSARFRLFGLRLERALNPNLQYCVMPYDRRLDGPDSPIPGTLADFASRALRHFASLIRCGKTGNGDLAADREVVSHSLQDWRFPEIPLRTAKTDSEIQNLIAENWHVVRGQSGKMLRHLRDELRVACEQGRFRRLFNQVAETRRTVQGGGL